MKRYNGLFDRIVDIENIKRAHQQARRGKTHYREVKMVDADADHYAYLIQQMLPFRAQIIFNGKYYTFKGCENEDNS